MRESEEKRPRLRRLGDQLGAIYTTLQWQSRGQYSLGRLVVEELAFSERRGLLARLATIDFLLPQKEKTAKVLGYTSQARFTSACEA